MKIKKEQSRGAKNSGLEKELEQVKLELEQKNHELEVEASLEKVRGVALGMRKPGDLLKICRVLFSELRLLGFRELRNAMINIHDDEAGSFLNYDYSDAAGATVTTVLYNSHPATENLVKQIKKSNDAFGKFVIKGKELDVWRAYRKGMGEQDDPKLDTTSALSYYFYSIGTGSLGISTYSPVTEKKLNVLKRFRNVFDFAYRRYMDVAQAEAQAKEARIEASLERMRTVVMSMRKSEELIAVCKSMYRELMKLGFTNIRNAQIVIKDQGKETYFVNTWSDATTLSIHEHPLDTSPIIREIYNELEKSKDSFYYKELSGKEFKEWRLWRMGIDAASKDDKLMNVDSVCFYLYSIDMGHMGISTFNTITKEQLEILVRFKKVFELSYRRYIDVAQAEAQAREAQIQLALERIRARTMAMQNSNELPEAANLLFQQVQSLGMPAWSAGYCIWDEDKKAITLWMSSEGVFQPPFKAPTTEDELFIQMRKGYEQGKALHVVEMGGKKLAAHYQYMRTLPVVGKILDSIIAAGHPLPTFQIMHQAYFSKGFLLFITYEPVPESHDLFKRFASVFDQTYTRFLDLQKAEAQAREAQIELALERVRARTMAMQSPSEFADVITVVGEQFIQLGFDIEWVNFGANGTDIAGGIDTWNFAVIPGGKPVSTRLFIPRFDHPLFVDAAEQLDNYRRTGNDFFVMTYDKKKKDEWLDHLFTKTIFKDVPDEYRAIQYAKAGYTTSNLALKDTFLSIGKFDTRPFTDEQHAILKRFGNAFGQANTRFLDLQKAEAQAREAQIQLALERIRARTMAMRKSDELNDVVLSLIAQMNELHIDIDGININILEEGTDGFDSWFVAPDYKKAFCLYTPFFDNPVMNDIIRAIKNKDELLNKVYSKKDKDAYFTYLYENSAYGNLPEERKKMILGANSWCLAVGIANITGISIHSYTGKTFTDNELDILKRFAKVFDQSYQRFLDLQKAEAQAREAQIEASLERVRAKAMAMHNSMDLTEAAGTVFTELKKLGIHPIRTGFVLLTNESRKAKLYPATSFDKEHTLSFTGEFEFTGHPVFEKQYESWQKKENYFPVLEGEILKTYYEILSVALSIPYKNFPTDKKQYGSFLPFTGGFLFTWSDEQYSEKEINILDRFKNILDLTIRRYTDLKTAEAQAREAKIEAALERVRAKAMAMHSSEDLTEANNAFYRELKALSVTPRRCGVALIDKESRVSEITTMNTTEEGDSIKILGHVKMTGHHILNEIFEHWLRQEEYHVVLRSNEIKEYYKELSKQVSFPDYSHDDVQYGYYFMFNEGDVYAWTDRELTEDDLKIYRRFTSVISLTYKRYRDLQQAEAQAREAKIEAALERVRARAMAMYKSNDLNDAVAIAFEELEKLNLGIIRCGIGILSREKRCADVFTTTIAGDGRTVQVSGDESMDIHPLLQNAYEAWLRNEVDYSHQLEGREIIDYYRALTKTNFHLPESQQVLSERKGYKQFTYHANFESGALFAFRETPFPEEAKMVMRRFATVFNLAYKRFLDLQKAEEQAREAQIEVALERVRSRTLAMQRSDELAETAAVLFRQLIILGIEPNRLYIGIIKDDSGTIEAWATDENGGRVSTMFLLNSERNISVKKMFDGWKEQKKTITIDMQGQELKDYFQYLDEDLKVPLKLGLSQKRRVQNIAYFSKGFIGLASPDSQSEATISLLERFASVFNLTYTRFNDLQLAEQHAEQAKLDLIKLQFEKKRAENALTDLRATQAQLIQSEKMASLGELTAGIAHEIKNPLNFVNNFSELSTDLVDEFINATDESERKELAEDLKKNLTIISEHGRRADSIVKNMLEHSRTGSGKKQLTDINQLCVEFFNLAYHGNRANIPDFNCEMKKDITPGLPQINVVSQDISRVLLNLFNNAFYAVNEKSRQSATVSQDKKYKPAVELITKSSNQQIIILVRDNGNGIPGHIKEKIFEPFFTTKPAGQGTGLGLSLSYDIITNGHGGELKVETKEGEGSTFIILLPVN